MAYCSSFLETANSAGQVVLYCATVHRNLADTKSIIATVLAGSNGIMQLIFAKYIDKSSSK